MSTTRAYVTAVVAGAMTAGIGAANVLATPPDVAAANPSARDVDLAASITIPIIDFDERVGPLTLIRKLFIEAGTNPLLLGIIQEGGNSYDLPGLFTQVNSQSHPRVEAYTGPGFVDFGFDSDGSESGGWDLLGAVQSAADITDSRSLHFRPLLGGTGGIGAALYGTLGDSTVKRNLNFLGSYLNTSGDSTVGDFNGELALLPWDGFKVVGLGTAPATAGDPLPSATLIDSNRVTQFKLGSLTGQADSDVTLDGGAGLCLGSAKASCGGNTAFLEFGAPVKGGLTIGSTNIISGDFSTNRVVSTLGNGQFSVQGAIGGTVKVGNLPIGQPIPINIQIPRAASMMSSASTRQQQSVKNSFQAVPRKLASDNETGGTHRAPLRDAVANIKAAVDNAVSGKHAKPETKDSED